MLAWWACDFDSIKPLNLLASFQTPGYLSDTNRLSEGDLIMWRVTWSLQSKSHALLLRLAQLSFKTLLTAKPRRYYFILLACLLIWSSMAWTCLLRDLRRLVDGSFGLNFVIALSTGWVSELEGWRIALMQDVTSIKPHSSEKHNHLGSSARRILEGLQEMGETGEITLSALLVSRRIRWRSLKQSCWLKGANRSASYCLCWRYQLIHRASITMTVLVAFLRYRIHWSFVLWSKTCGENQKYVGDRTSSYNSLLDL